MRIDLNSIYNPNVLGELFRELTFLTTEEGQLGCYSTFDLRPNFLKISDKEDLQRIAEKLSVDEEEIGQIQAYFNPEMALVVAWFWDGDGTLFFEMASEDEKVSVINYDCKKAWNWSFCDS